MDKKTKKSLRSLVSLKRFFKAKKTHFSDRNSKSTVEFKLPRIESECNLWGVVTTINAPTESIYKVLEQPKMCVVIVADLKTPTEEYFKLEKNGTPYHFYLSKNKNRWGTLKFQRTNLGIILVVKILDMHMLFNTVLRLYFDDDNKLISGIPLIQEQNWLVADSVQVFNPFPTFIELEDIAWPII